MFLFLFPLLLTFPTIQVFVSTRQNLSRGVDKLPKNTFYFSRKTKKINIKTEHNNITLVRETQNWTSVCMHECVCETLQRPPRPEAPHGTDTGRPRPCFWVLERLFSLKRCDSVLMRGGAGIHETDSTLQPWALFDINTLHRSRNRHGQTDTLYWPTDCRKEVHAVSWNAGSYQILLTVRGAGEHSRTRKSDRDTVHNVSRRSRVRPRTLAVQAGGEESRLEIPGSVVLSWLR